MNPQRQKELNEQKTQEWKMEESNEEGRSFEIKMKLQTDWPFRLTFQQINANNLALGKISSNVGGFTKRATVSAINFVMYCVRNIIGPQRFFAREAPRYQVYSTINPEYAMYREANTFHSKKKSGFLATIVSLAVATIDILVMGYLLRRENSKRGNDTSQVPGDDNGEIVDMTSIKKKRFRYAW